MTVLHSYMHKAPIALCAFLLSWTLGAQSIKDRCSRETVRFQQLEREYYVYVPSTMKAEGAPLVIAMHGYGGGGTVMPGELMQVAERGGFLLCLPTGIKGKDGHNGWNVGYPFQDEMKVDDVKFICFLKKKLQKQYNLSKTDAFLTGMSNGGEMCYLTAMRAPKAFKAIASIAGLTLEWMVRSYDYKTPVNFMEVHGTEDRISEWLGDPTDQGGWGVYLPVPAAVANVIGVNECTREEVVELPRREGRNPVTLYKFTNGKPAQKGGAPTEVWLYKVTGGDHSWSERDMDTFNLIWDFFARFTES